MENEVFQSKVLDYLANQTQEITEMNSKFTQEMTEIKDKLSSVEKIVINIEQNHSNKLGILFDAIEQHSEQLDRIEKNVSLHEEYIMKRIK